MPASDLNSLVPESAPDMSVRWYSSNAGNFANALNRELATCVSTEVWNKELGVEHTNSGNAEGKFLAVGSVMQSALRKFDFVLGAGIEKSCPENNHWEDGTPLSDTSRLLSVRGMETAKCFPKLSFDVTGDPALFMAHVCPRWRTMSEFPGKRDAVCVMASTTDASVVKEVEVLGESVNMPFHILSAEVDADDMDASFKLASEMNDKCKLMVSSSLHGLVVSDVLKIPSLLYNKVHADGSRPVGMLEYDDYASGINYNETWPKGEIVGTIGEAVDKLSQGAISASRIQKKELDTKAAKWIKLVSSVRDWLQEHPNHDQTKHILTASKTSDDEPSAEQPAAAASKPAAKSAVKPAAKSAEKPADVQAVAKDARDKQVAAEKLKKDAMAKAQAALAAKARAEAANKAKARAAAEARAAKANQMKAEKQVLAEQKIAKDKASRSKAAADAQAEAAAAVKTAIQEEAKARSEVAAAAKVAVDTKKAADALAEAKKVAASMHAAEAQAADRAAVVQKAAQAASNASAVAIKEAEVKVAEVKIAEVKVAEVKEQAAKDFVAKLDAKKPV